MSDTVTNAAAQEELVALRAEVAQLRRAMRELQGHQSRPHRPGLFEPDPKLPGLTGLWRGERGLAWQLFVQGAIAVQVGLAVVAGITIVH
jgi:hypothetical protein